MSLLPTGSPQKPLVSVITPSLPGRSVMRLECQVSVAAQTFREHEHLIFVDTNRDGCSATCNRLARMAEGEFLFPLADDDLLLPGCLRAHVAVSANADIVFGPPLVSGEDPHQFWGDFPWVPSSALIRRSLWMELGGYAERLTTTEDRDFFERAQRAGARVTRIDEPTWVYRFHGRNKSRNREPHTGET